MGRMTYTEPQCLYSKAIPLLPLWAVRPVQSLSACTVELYLYSPYGLYGLYRVSVPVQSSYTTTPPMGRTACTEPQCLYSRAIPLLPLWAIRLVQSLSACTVELYLYSPYGPYSLYRALVPVQYSYTSTPPMGRTACTEPQCLYSRAIPLLPLRAVRLVQSLSACTVELYLYSPYGPYGLYRALVPVQGCTLPFLPFPLKSASTNIPTVHITVEQMNIQSTYNKLGAFKFQATQLEKH
jgi:hypothetical protein